MTIATAHYLSPIGTFIIKMSSLGIQSVQWTEEKMSKKIPKELEECVAQLEEYFQGKRQKFTIPLDWSNGADFDKKVWQYLQEIPYGKTVSYSQVAKDIGLPKAVRAVGAANARNPIPIIVPCHRVIGKNGSLVGFAYGLDMKARLLSIERPLEFGKQVSLF